MYIVVGLYHQKAPLVTFNLGCSYLAQLLLMGLTLQGMFQITDIALESKVKVIKLIICHEVCTCNTNSSALDKLLGQLGIYATWLSSIAYLQKQLRIFIFFTPHFFSVITHFLIA